MKTKLLKTLALVLLAAVILVAAGGYVHWLRGKFNWTAALMVDNLKETARTVAASNARLAQVLAENRMLTAEVDYLAANRGRPLPPAGSPNVILIINDAMRADRLGINNPESAFSPNLDRLADRAFNFSHAVSQAGWTSPSVTSILTGVYPNRHRLFNRHRTGRFKANLTTLQEIFREAGYFTAAFTGRNADWFREMLDRGFFSVLVSEDDKGAETIDRVISFLKKRRLTPYFLLVHVYDPHNGYTPALPPDYPPEVAAAIEALPEGERTDKVNGGHPSGNPLLSRAAWLNYARECEELDYQWGRLLDFLFKGPKDAFDSRRDILVFTSDHGEEFEAENGFCWHGRSPAIENLRVPLIVSLPGVEPGSSPGWVENRALFGTILTAAGLENRIPARQAGPTLLPLMRGERPDGDGWCLAEALYKDPLWPKVNETKSLISPDGFKLDYDTRTRQVKLFDLNTDPTEDHDLSRADEHRDRINDMKARLSKLTKLNYDYR